MKLRTPTLILLLVSTLAAGTLHFLLDGREDGEQALIEQRYADAVRLLEGALEAAPIEEQDELLLLLARAQWLNGQIDPAVETYRRLLSNFPDSEVVDQARVQQAEALASSNRYEEAAELYRTQVERLTAPARKEEIAEVYLGLASKALASDPPDRARAVTFYDLALGLGLSEDRESSVQLRAADQLLLANRFAEAVARYERLVDRLSVERGQLRAMLGLGKARLGNGNLVGARSVLRELLALEPEDAQVGDALYELARTFGVPTPSHSMIDRAVDALRTLEERAPDHPKAKVAEFLIAQCAQHTGRSEDALRALSRFLAQRSGEGLPEVATARAMLGDVLNSQDRLLEAMAAWRRYLAEHPSHPQWERVQRAVIDAEYQRAVVAMNDDRYDEARGLFDEFSDIHPLDGRNARIQLQLADMQREQEQYEGAIDTWTRCASKYRGRPEASEAQFRIGEIYDGELFDPVKALAAFRAVPGGTQWFTQAQARIQALETISMSLQTERSFRSGESAQFELTARNLREVRVRTWRLDLETWFRAMHTPSAIDALDVEVIEPDTTETSATPDYQPYEETTRSIDVGDGRPGCYVVKVDGGELEATTMVLVTDLGLIVESSRKELVVFAQDLKEDRVAAGVQVIVSDGEQIVLEGVTDEDGLFRHRGGELANLAELSVFASDATGSGAGTLGLSGLGLAEGLTQKTWMFTDKPAYQPGSLVHLKGVIREVRDGLYALPEGEHPYQVTVSSPSGRPVFEAELELTNFGTFAVDFVVPEVAGSGTWSVRSERSDGQFVAIKNLTVEEFQLPKLDVGVELDENVVFPGESVEGRVTARHFYGSNAANRPVSVWIAWSDGSQHSVEGVTDASGQFEFKFSTDDLGEEAFATVTASLPEAGASRTASVQLVTTALELSVSTVREVYTVGEPMEATVAVKTRTGEPHAGPVQLDLLRLEPNRRGTAEISVQVEESRSDAGGLARVTVASADGGRHVLRATVTDRFGNRVTSQRLVFVSGEEDEVRLRLLTDRENFEVGETVDLRVLNRSGPRLALVTQRGDGVLHCEVRRLEGEDSILPIELQSEHAPNFGLAISLIDGTALRRASRQFLVARRLNLQIEVPEGDFDPGEMVPVTVTTRDVEGRPVAAELALALVDEALIARYPFATEDPVSVFYGQLREVGSYAVTSAGWSYSASGRRAQLQLLQEEQRLEALQLAAGQGPGGSDGIRARGRVGLIDELQRRLDHARRAGGADVVALERQLALAQVQQQAPQSGNVLFFDDFGTSDGVAEVSVDFRGLGSLAYDLESAFDSNAWNSALGLGDMAGRVVSNFGYQPDSTLTVQTRNFFAGYEGQTVTGTTALPILTQVQFQTLNDGPLSNGNLFYAGLPFVGGEALVDLSTNEPRSVFAPDGFWISTLQTDDQGRVVVEVPMPDRSSGWSLLTRAVTVDTDLAIATTSLRTSEQLVASVDAPSVLVEGDETSVSVELNHLRRTGDEAALDLEVEVLGESDEVRIRPGSEARIRRTFTADSVDRTELTAEIGGDAEKTAKRELRVRPYGQEVAVSRSGTLTGSDRVRLELPSDKEWSELALRVEVGPDPARHLTAMVLGGPLGFRAQYVSTISLEARLDRAIAASAVLDHLDRIGAGSRADRQALEGLMRETLAQVLTTQANDGASNRYEGMKGAPNRRPRPDFAVTVKSLRFLQAARARGLQNVDPALLRASDWLNGRLGGRNPWDQAMALEALAAAGRARFENLNALHRQRESIAVHARARLALAWHELGRSGLANEALDALISAWPKMEESSPRVIETYADCLRALVTIRPNAVRLESYVRVLDRARRGMWFQSPPATARAVEALAAAGGNNAAIQDDATVEVSVDGLLLGEVTRNAEEGVVVLELPVDRVRRVHDITLQLEGRGEARWSASLTGFTKGFGERPDNPIFAVANRHYLRPYLKLNGQEVRPGFSIAQSPYDSFRPNVGTVNVGEEFRAEVNWSSNTNGVRTGRLEKIDSVVIEEPLPAGCSVVPDSVQGRFSEVRILPDRILFYYPPGIDSDWIRFRMVGRYQGRYRVLPTEVFDANNPARVARSLPREFIVLPRDAESPSAVRWSPDELFALGEDAFNRSDYGVARSLLSELTTGWTLKDATLKQVARMMLQVAIEAGDARETVVWFEQLKERYSDLILSFESMRAVGNAYRSLGEFEASVVVFRGIAEASFLKDAAVSETLRQQNEQEAANEFLVDLVADYPGLPTMRQALYGIAQGLALQAVQRSQAAPAGNDDPLAKALRTRASEIFRSFLIWYPEDPFGPEVSFAWATTLIEGEDLAGALEVSESALRRYSNSSFEDDFLYTVGFARFALGQTEPALEVLRRVANESFRTTRGVAAPSENRNHAIYLEGQIHHSMGEVEDALADYERVEQAFSDAQDAVKWFRRRSLSLPEVVRLGSGEAGTFTMSYRNLESVDLKVYRVDLMRLYLLEKSLNDIGGVLLHGIRPHFESTIDLEGLDFRSHERSVDLPVEESGAYLVVARAGTDIQSGLLLRSDLEIEAQEDTGAGRIRVHVQREGAVLPSAHVKIVGSGDGQIRSGDADLRGVFSAGDLIGEATVIARVGDEYAFWRGDSIHQPHRYRPQPERLLEQLEEVPTSGEAFDPFGNNFLLNGDNRAGQVRWLNDNVLNVQQEGVEVYRAKK
ncbi:MAG: tetratricopeptide repeat protein [Planctomycetota bacterium]